MRGPRRKVFDSRAPTWLPPTLAPASVDVDRSALDLVVAAGAAQDVMAFDENLAGPGQRDAGLAATQHDLALGFDDMALPIGHHRHGGRRRHGVMQGMGL